MMRNKDLSRKNDKTLKAAQIYEYSYEAGEAFLEAYRKLGSQEAERRGPPTNTEQDLLRAMVVMCGAGLDAVVKQLLKDCLHTIAAHDSGSKEHLTKFISNDLKKEERGFLAKSIAHGDMTNFYRGKYIDYLCGDSMQSYEQLNRAAAALGIDIKQIDSKKLKEAFSVRNKIVHELDIDLSTQKRGKRNRTIRKQHEMEDHFDILLDVSKIFIEKVDSKLT